MKIRKKNKLKFKILFLQMFYIFIISFFILTANADYTIEIPKTIVLENKNAFYDINVSGDIFSQTEINELVIKPENLNFYMKDVSKSPNTKEDVIATIIQDKTIWTTDDVSNSLKSTNNMISAENLSAGNWYGTFNFNIKLNVVHYHDFSKSIYKETTCTENGINRYTCSCGYFYDEETPALGHDYSQVNGKKATCTTSGYGYSCCSRCMELNPNNTEMIRIEALNHDYVTNIIEPTCTNNGYTEHICTRCSHYYISDEKSKTNHNYQIIEQTKSDCKTKGKITYCCDICGLTKTIETEIGEHSYDEGSIVLPTCTKDGYTLYTCLVCGETKIENNLYATGHNFDDGIITKPATCETYGEKVYTCHNCGYQKSERIEMYGHMYYGSTFICSICKKSIIWNFELDNENKIMKIISMKDECKNTLKNITIPSKVMINDELYSIEFIKSTYDGLTKNSEGFMIPNNPKGPFVGNSVIESVLFEEGSVMEDNDMSCMFLSCYNLKKVENIPDSVENMKMTFEYCTSLEEVPKLPNNVTHLIDTFKFCSGLKDVGTVTIPQNVRCMAGIFHSCFNMSGTVNIYSINVNLTSPNNGYRPFMPCYRSFYLAGRDTGNTIKLCVYKYKDETSYNQRSSDNWTTNDLNLYSDTYKNLYHGNNTSVIYYYTDNTYTTQASEKTSYSANYSPTGDYVSKYTWTYPASISYKNRMMMRSFTDSIQKNIFIEDFDSIIEDDVYEEVEEEICTEDIDFYNENIIEENEENFFNDIINIIATD